MKTALSKTPGGVSVSKRGSTLTHIKRSSAAPVLPRRNLAGRDAAPTTICYSSFGVSSVDAPSMLSLVGQVASAGAWALAAWMGYQLAIQQVRLNNIILEIFLWAKPSLYN